MHEVYFSTDIESDGPIPGPNSMLSFGSVALLPDKTVLGKFTRNLELLPGAAPDPDTAAWWKTKPQAWEACRKDLVDPAVAMKDYVAWVKSINGKPVFVGYPATFDFMFVYWYMIKFAGESPFSFSALDIKSFVMRHLGTDFRGSTKRNMPKHWFDKVPHNHVALDDALEQGFLFCNILKDARR
jgi:hypothetical protein